MSFWGHPFIQPNVSKQFDELVRSFGQPQQRAIFQLAIDDRSQPALVIRNGDLGITSQPKSINVNATANFTVLQYLRYCPTGIEPGASTTRRYTRHEASEEYPYGFSYDDLFRGVACYNECATQRFASTETRKKKAGDLLSSKIPPNGKTAIYEFARAGAQHYGGYLADDTDDTMEVIPVNEAQKATMTMAMQVRTLQKQYLEAEAKARLRKGSAGDETKDKRVDVDRVFTNLHKRTGFLARVNTYNTLSRESGAGHKTARRGNTLDAMDYLPPIDHQTVMALIEEIYAKGLLMRPTITSVRGEDILEKFQAMLPGHDSIQQYMAIKEREGEVLQQTIDEGTLPMDGRANERHFEDLKQCHALLALIPSRLPVAVDFVKALKFLGWYKPDAEGDEKYTDLRIDRRDKANGSPVNPHGISLTAAQVVGKLNGPSWHRSVRSCAPISHRLVPTRPISPLSVYWLTMDLQMLSSHARW